MSAGAFRNFGFSVRWPSNCKPPSWGCGGEEAAEERSPDRNIPLQVDPGGCCVPRGEVENASFSDNTEWNRDPLLLLVTSRGNNIHSYHHHHSPSPKKESSLNLPCVRSEEKSWKGGRLLPTSECFQQTADWKRLGSGARAAEVRLNMMKWASIFSPDSGQDKKCSTKLDTRCIVNIPQVTWGTNVRQQQAQRSSIGHVRSSGWPSAVQ